MPPLGIQESEVRFSLIIDLSKSAKVTAMTEGASSGSPVSRTFMSTDSRRSSVACFTSRALFLLMLLGTLLESS
jgi:hypothetical protein